MSWRTAPLCLALFAAAGCGGAEAGADPGGWRVERDTVGDTLVVRTLSGSVWPAGSRMAQVMSIGVADGDERLMLGSVRGLAVAPDGSVYVMDGRTALKKFAPDGQYVATFGRSGSGPGEYRSPDGGLAVLADGRVVLRDPGNGRLQVYAPDGTPLTTWRISSGLSTSRRLYTDTAGNVYTMVLYEQPNGADEWKLGLARFDTAGVVRDSVPAPRWPVSRAIIKAQREGSTSTSNVPFSPQSHWAWSPLGYMVGGVSSRYRIQLLHPDHPLWIERTVAPVPVQPEEAADEKRARTEQFREDYPGWVWNGPDIPATKPAFRELFVGEDGRIWVVLSRPGVKDSTVTNPQESGWSEPNAFDVFEPDGTYLGQVDGPPGFQDYPVPVFRGDTMWAAVQDEDGVLFVRRYEVRHPTAGSAAGGRH